MRDHHTKLLLSFAISLNLLALAACKPSQPKNPTGSPSRENKDQDASSPDKQFDSETFEIDGDTLSQEVFTEDEVDEAMSLFTDEEREWIDLLTFSTESDEIAIYNDIDLPDEDSDEALALTNSKGSKGQVVRSKPIDQVTNRIDKRAENEVAKETANSKKVDAKINEPTKKREKIEGKEAALAESKVALNKALGDLKKSDPSISGKQLLIKGVNVLIKERKVKAIDRKLSKLDKQKAKLRDATLVEADLQRNADRLKATITQINNRRDAAKNRIKGYPALKALRETVIPGTDPAQTVGAILASQKTKDKSDVKTSIITLRQYGDKIVASVVVAPRAGVGDGKSPTTFFATTPTRANDPADLTNPIDVQTGFMSQSNQRITADTSPEVIGQMMFLPKGMIPKRGPTDGKRERLVAVNDPATGQTKYLTVELIGRNSQGSYAIVKEITDAPANENRPTEDAKKPPRPLPKIPAKPLPPTPENAATPPLPPTPENAGP